MASRNAWLPEVLSWCQGSAEAEDGEIGFQNWGSRCLGLSRSMGPTWILDRTLSSRIPWALAVSGSSQSASDPGPFLASASECPRTETRR
jgi:hypothetical protein